MIKILNGFDFSDLKSMTVDAEDVSALVISAGDFLSMSGKKVLFEKDTVAIVNRWDGKHYVTIIRDTIETSDPSKIHQTEMNTHHDIAFAERMRNIARSHGAIVKTVSGGIKPLVHEDEVLLPDFEMSGTSWFVIPRSVAVANELVWRAGFPAEVF